MVADCCGGAAGPDWSKRADATHAHRCGVLQPVQARLESGRSGRLRVFHGPSTCSGEGRFRVRQLPIRRSSSRGHSAPDVEDQVRGAAWTGGSVWTGQGPGRDRCPVGVCSTRVACPREPRAWPRAAMRLLGRRRDVVGLARRSAGGPAAYADGSLPANRLGSRPDLAGGVVPSAGYAWRWERRLPVTRR